MDPDSGLAALPDTARPAWDAYRAMLDSKAAHFDFLDTVTRKTESGGRRSLAEAARLETLLAAHTTAVKAFQAAVRELVRIDAPARDALLDLLGRVNEGLTSASSGNSKAAH